MKIRFLFACSLSVTAPNVNVNWSLTLPVQQINFTVRKAHGSPCSYFVTFSRGGASAYNDRRMTRSSTQLRYQLYKEAALANILKELPDVTTTSEIITGSFGTGSNLTNNHTYFVEIPFSLATNPTLKPNGIYTDNFVLKVIEGTFPGPSSPDDTDTVQLRTTIPKIAQLSLVNSGGSFDPNDTAQTLSFGALTAGASRGFDLRILTNAGFQVTFSSQNNGVMRHSVPAISTTVPYTLTVNGSTKNLSTSATSPVVVATGSGQTGTQGTGNPVAVTIDSVSDKMAGDYTDYITVTAATTE